MQFAELYFAELYMVLLKIWCEHLNFSELPCSVAKGTQRGAASGGAIGGLTGKLWSAPLKAELKDFGANLPPGSSAIVALIEPDWVPQLQAELEAEGARLVHDLIQADIVNQFNAGGNELYTSGDGNLGSGTVCIADRDSESQLSGILVSENGVLVDNTVITSEPLEETITPTANCEPRAFPLSCMCMRACRTAIICWVFRLQRQQRHEQRRREVRLSGGKQPNATAGSIDSQPVKTTENDSIDGTTAC